MVRLLAICLIALPLMATSAFAESKKNEDCDAADQSKTAATGTEGAGQKGDETGYGSSTKGGGDNDFDAAEDGCPVDEMKAAPPPDEKRNG